MKLRFWGTTEGGTRHWPNSWDGDWRVWLHNDGHLLRFGVQIEWPRIYIEVAKWELGMRF